MTGEDGQRTMRSTFRHSGCVLVPLIPDPPGPLDREAVRATSPEPCAAGESGMIAWHHQLGQAGKLIVDRWTRDHWAEDKLRDAYGHIRVDTPQYRIGSRPGGV